ncbi:MAG: hypothetical protein RLZZ450_4450, partial [Pseudomonadota bacterium]
MVAGNTEDTALGVSRTRFLESLPRKAIELRGAVALLSETPAAEGPRDDMRRRLHALYASALVFRNDALARAVHEAIDRLDAVREAGRSLESPDLELLTTLVKRLPDLRGEPAREAAAEPERPIEPFSVPPPELSFSPRTIPPPAPISTRALSRPPATLAPPDPSVVRRPLLQRVLHVLLLPDRGEESELVELLRCDSLRVTAVASVEAVIASVHDDAPDLVLANEQLALDGGLLAALRTEASADASTDFVPVVVYEGAHAARSVEVVDASLHGLADGRVLRPFRADQLVRTIGRATGTLVEPVEPRSVGELTLDQLADRVASELRRGLVDTVSQGRGGRISFGDGAEVLAATYGALAELRAAVVRESDGRIAYETRGRNGVPALVTAVPSSFRSRAEAPSASTERAHVGEGAPRQSSLSLLANEEQRLHGRRVVLAEDDTAIALLLANLLREQ